jgi:hypothetical protein
VTNQSLLKDFGNRDPKVIPLPLARLVVTVMRTAGIVVPRLRANVRRIEMIWFGQAQAPSWLEGAGWHPPHGREVWREMGAAFRSESHVNAS